jgi:hypothetical protein
LPYPLWFTAVCKPRHRHQSSCLLARLPAPIPFTLVEPTLNIRGAARTPGGN